MRTAFVAAVTPADLGERIPIPHSTCYARIFRGVSSVHRSRLTGRVVVRAAAGQGNNAVAEARRRLLRRNNLQPEEARVKGLPPPGVKPRQQGASGGGGRDGGGKLVPYRQSRAFTDKVKAMRRNDWEGVLGELARAEATYAAQGSKLTMNMYAVCIGHLAKSSRWREALEVLRDIRRGGRVPCRFCLNNAINACSTAGQWRQAVW